MIDPAVLFFAAGVAAKLVRSVVYQLSTQLSEYQECLARLPLGYALVVVFRGLRKRSAKPFTAGCGYLAATILGFNLPLILFTWEVHRYRFRTDALSLALLAVLLADVYRAVKWRWLTFAPVTRARQALATFPYGVRTRRSEPGPDSSAAEDPSSLRRTR